MGNAQKKFQAPAELWEAYYGKSHCVTSDQNVEQTHFGMRGFALDLTAARLCLAWQGVRLAMSNMGSWHWLSEKKGHVIAFN